MCRSIAQHVTSARERKAPVLAAEGPEPRGPSGLQSGEAILRWLSFAGLSARDGDLAFARFVLRVLDHHRQVAAVLVDDVVHHRAALVTYTFVVHGRPGLANLDVISHLLGVRRSADGAPGRVLRFWGVAL